MAKTKLEKQRFFLGKINNEPFYIDIEITNIKGKSSINFKEIITQALHVTTGEVKNYFLEYNYDYQKLIQELELTNNSILSKEQITLLFDIIKQYNYNDNSQGTIKQIECLNKNNTSNKILTYQEEQTILKEHNILIDEGIRYGTNFMINPIPKHIINQLVHILPSFQIKNSKKQIQKNLF